jgi:hypothetical protein
MCETGKKFFVFFGCKTVDLYQVRQFSVKFTLLPDKLKKDLGILGTLRLLDSSPDI